MSGLITSPTVVRGSEFAARITVNHRLQTITQDMSAEHRTEFFAGMFARLAGVMTALIGPVRARNVLAVCIQHCETQAKSEASR